MEARKTAIEIYEELRTLIPPIPVDSFERFIEGIEKAARRMGEGQKLGRRTEFFSSGARTDYLMALLKYWNVGKDNYQQLMNDAVGEEWGQWMSRSFEYREVPKKLEQDVVDPVINTFKGIFERR